MADRTAVDHKAVEVVAAAGRRAAVAAPAVVAHMAAAARMAVVVRMVAVVRMAVAARSRLVLGWMGGKVRDCRPVAPGCRAQTIRSLVREVGCSRRTGPEEALDGVEHCWLRP